MALFTRTPVTSTGVSYNGHNPVVSAPYIPPLVNPGNTPAIVQLNGLDLPGDVEIRVNGKKVLAISKILDAINVGTTISVVERIAREPYEIEFNFNVWLLSKNGFPLEDLVNIWDFVWLPDTVCSVVSTYLNRLGVTEVIISEITPLTQRGSTNLPCTIKCYENVPGQSLLIGSPTTQSGTAQ